jgi:hypothetical protein
MDAIVAFCRTPLFAVRDDLVRDFLSEARGEAPAAAQPGGAALAGRGRLAAGPQMRTLTIHDPPSRPRPRPPASLPSSPLLSSLGISKRPRAAATTRP